MNPGEWNAPNTRWEWRNEVKNASVPHEYQGTYCPELILSSLDLLASFVGKFMHMLSSTVESDEGTTGSSSSYRRKIYAGCCWRNWRLTIPTVHSFKQFNSPTQILSCLMACCARWMFNIANLSDEKVYQVRNHFCWSTQTRACLCWRFPRCNSSISGRRTGKWSGIARNWAYEGNVDLNTRKDCLSQSWMSLVLCLIPQRLYSSCKSRYP
jgi:hypothetical protein